METRFDHFDAVLSKLASGMSIMTRNGTIGGHVNQSEAKQGGSVQPDELPAYGSQLRCSLLFNNRLGHIKAHTIGGKDSTSIYMSSVFLSILSPENISMLAQKLNDPMLPQRLEDTSHKVWREMQTVFVEMFGDNPEFNPDLELLQASMLTYSGLQETIIGHLMPIREVGLVHSLPEPLKRGQLAAIVLLGCIDMKMRKNYGRFSEQAAEASKRAAIYQTIRTLNFMRFSPPGFLQVRLSTLLIFLLVGLSAVPSLMSFLDPILAMSKAIGLDNPDKTLLCPAEEAEWRETVWLIVRDVTYNFRIMMSQHPPEISDSSTFWLKSILMKPEMKYFGQARQIHRIYDRAYEFTFAPQYQNHSAKEIGETILSLDKELTEWRQDFGDASWNEEFDPATGVNGMMNYVALAMLRTKYHYVLLAVHSIPAFYPDMLPVKMPESLEKAAGAARALYEMGLAAQNSKGECTMVTGAAVTTGICTLLYKQLYYPSELSNRGDLELLRANLSSFRNTRWSSIDNEIPAVEVWKALIDIMGRHYELFNPDFCEVPAINRELLPEEFFQGGEECTII